MDSLAKCFNYSDRAWLPHLSPCLLSPSKKHPHFLDHSGELRFTSKELLMSPCLATRAGKRTRTGADTEQKQALQLWQALVTRGLTRPCRPKLRGTNMRSVNKERHWGTPVAWSLHWLQLLAAGCWGPKARQKHFIDRRVF